MGYTFFDLIGYYCHFVYFVYHLFLLNRFTATSFLKYHFLFFRHLCFGLNVLNRDFREPVGHLLRSN